MTAYRCSSCGINWPILFEFRLCPQCLLRCFTMGDAQPDMEDAEAHSMKHYADFGRFVERRDAAALKATADDIARLPELRDRRLRS
jgi:hypothetical protein